MINISNARSVRTASSAILFCASAVQLALLGASPLRAAELSSGTADGQVTVDVNAGGGFATAVYNPVGPLVADDAAYLSEVYFRFGSTGQRTALSQFGATVISLTDRRMVSSFNLGALQVTLVQTLNDLVQDGIQTGSLLSQSFTFVNSGSAALDFELIRYMDGDLPYANAGILDGGGLLNLGGRTVLFETDTATGQNDSSTFLGIYNEGGTSLGYDIDEYSTLQTRFLEGGAPRNAITNDADGDHFIDAGQNYDVALGLGAGFSLGAGAQGTFTTSTIFGSGLPGSVPVPSVPEPASWALMIAGFALAGSQIRRRAAINAPA